MRVGYAWLAEQPNVLAPMPEHYAEVRSVTRIEAIGPCTAVPASVAPDGSSLLSHVLFAIKHEGINLTILAQVLPQIAAAELNQAYQATPSSQYLRKICYLWEYFTGSELEQSAKALRSNYVPLFDPKLYITATGYRNTRWRVLFNGIGSLDYCVTVRKTARLTEKLDKQLLVQAQTFTDTLAPDILNRTLAWAYLDETKSSYAIENEHPSEGKASRYVNLLRQAHHPRQLTEDYLVELQNAAISNVFALAASFRNQQNYLGNGLRGALGVTYVPPAPELAYRLMDELMSLANHPPDGVDPLVLAAVISYGFVFVHPFMDGNGRLSRFLFHQVLCQSGTLKNGLLLPVSAVLKKHESEYKKTLEHWSAPTRQYWDVAYLDEQNFTFDFKGHPALYRYWDATECAEFMAFAAEQAIERHLKEETEYLNHFDAIYRRIDDVFDIANSDLTKLVIFCIEQKGRLSTKRRKQYQYAVPEEAFDALEHAYREVVIRPAASANRQPESDTNTD
ncbi:MAG TPA: Fic family protein [Marinagarivorans sp.]